MAVEFLTDEQAAGYRAFAGTLSRAELERYFFLDDTDRKLIQDKRRDHNRLGFAVQLTSVRFLGRFMADPRQVPAEVAEYLRERRVLLPGATTLERLVGSVREAANQRLRDGLYGLLSVGQRATLDWLLQVPPGPGVGVGPVAARSGAGVGPADGAGAGAGHRDRRAGDGRAGCVGGAAAAAGGVVAVRDRRQGFAAASAQRSAPVGHAAGHCGASDHARSR
ncbi:hypothetical protein GCM10010176_103070 [Nonomuraea spiralis]|nr:hypothetical protein GCM10010176_103070 [Nonomuraea spiralis]